VRRSLRYVRHEEVLCPLLPAAEGRSRASYRWVGFEAWRGLDGLLAMNRAGNLHGVRVVWKHSRAGADLVAADTTGAFGYYCTGNSRDARWCGRRRPSSMAATRITLGVGTVVAEHPIALNPEDV